MDLKKKGWFAQVTQTGIGEVKQFEGSVGLMLTELAKHLIATGPRARADGFREVVFRISNQPYTGSKEQDRIDSLAQELQQQLTASVDPSQIVGGPQPGETQEQFYDRLTTIEGFNHFTADWMVRDWFDLPPNPRLEAWLKDDKAAEFRRLNGSTRAFEKADPETYIFLKNYVLENYQEFTENLTFRIA